ncbi:MAG: non-homologous end-joining DNA ligase [Thermoleophilia bacterium]|nr:non-homologous end-joining DNA ligase [Thermoleophilia bacterium]
MRLLTPWRPAAHSKKLPQPTRITLDTQVFRLGEKEVKLTHLDRVYYPASGYTKADVLDYYLAVSPYLLPHLRGRPLTLERWPEGLEDGSFFQKDASEYFPEWLRTFPVKRKDNKKIIHYPLVEDAADLLYLVNLGTLTFHSQMARVDSPSHPDHMVLDIDPPELSSAESSKLAPFQKAAQVAFLLREELDQAGYHPLVKTSGKRGVHLAFPLSGDLDYEDARGQLRSLFEKLENKYPNLLTTQIRKNKRGGRVYLDALRMAQGATIVPPYVARATPEATVSMPVTWDELASLADGRAFTIRTALPRLERTGDLWEVLT